MPPTSPISSTSDPTYSLLSSSYKLPTSNHRLAQSSPGPGIWMMIPSLVGAHRPVKPSFIPCGTPTTPGSIVYYPPPLRTYPCQGGSCSDPDRVRTCRSWDREGGFGYPPPVPLLCPAHGGKQSVPGGVSNLGPSLDIYLWGTPAISTPWWRRPGRSRVLPGEGVVTPVLHFHHFVVPRNGYQEILTQGPPRTQDSEPFGYVGPGAKCPTPSSDVRTPPRNVPQWCDKADIPCLLPSWDFLQN